METANPLNKKSDKMPQPTLIAALDVLKQSGVFEVYLPFLLTFSIFYGLLKKMNLFGENSNKITTVVAGVAAAYVMIFSPAAIPISQFFATFFTQASVALVVLLVFIMVVGLLLSAPFLEPKGINLGKLAPWVVLVALLIIIGMFFSSGGAALFARVLPPGIKISGQDIALVILVLLTVGAIALLASGGGIGERSESSPRWRLTPA